MKVRDWLVVGAGLSGAVFAHEAKNRGLDVLVVDRADRAGGLCLSEPGFHFYGPHVFHTADAGVREYVSRFCRWETFVHAPAFCDYSEKMWGGGMPAEAKRRRDLRRGTAARGSYFGGEWTALPENLDYGPLFAGLLEGIPLLLGFDCFREKLPEAGNVYWTAPASPDAGGRRMAFGHTDIPPVPGRFKVTPCADGAVPWTRETLYWDRMTRELPSEEGVLCYPVGPVPRPAVRTEARTVFAGRFGSWRWLDMDQAVAESLGNAGRLL